MYGRDFESIKENDSRPTSLVSPDYTQMVVRGEIRPRNISVWDGDGSLTRGDTESTLRRMSTEKGRGVKLLRLHESG